MAAASPEKRPPRSLFELPSEFFGSSVLLRAHPSTAPSAAEPPEPSRPPPTTQQQQQPSESAGFRWTCNTCAAEFESLLEQREHFKSDLHRLNVKLSIAGKTIIKEEDLDKADSDSVFDDLEISSVSGSEDELENGPASERGLYVVRAKAGKRQSGKDATGKVAHSAGSSLRRYNEAALKKEVQELIFSWKSYFDTCVCAFIYAPSKNRQMLFDGDKTQSVIQACDIRSVPLTVHRPTLKEAKRVYSNLTQLHYEMECSTVDETLSHGENVTSVQQSEGKKKEVAVDSEESISELSVSLELLNKNEEATIRSSKIVTTPLHEAAKSGNAQLTLELLEQGLDPCIKDARGKTPYLLASDKEVRNTFRRFMALNLDKWDWHASDVPSALTKEMEESQAAKQAEKDAKKKARAKELKKLKKAREKEEKEKEKEKAKAQASQPQASMGQMTNRTTTVPGLKPKHQTPQQILIAKEEERQRKLAEEREKRAAAAERRLAAMAAQSAGTSSAAASNSGQKAAPDDNSCSCCFTSLAGKVPFHRYNYNYCSTTCMHLHSEMLQDD
nr:unnamed protein product [Digitaria exilis]